MSQKKTRDEDGPIKDSQKDKWRGQKTNRFDDKIGRDLRIKISNIKSQDLKGNLRKLSKNNNPLREGEKYIKEKEIKDFI